MISKVAGFCDGRFTRTKRRRIAEILGNEEVRKKGAPSCECEFCLTPLHRRDWEVVESAYTSKKVQNFFGWSIGHAQGTILYAWRKINGGDVLHHIVYDDNDPEDLNDDEVMACLLEPGNKLRRPLGAYKPVKTQKKLTKLQEVAAAYQRRWVRKRFEGRYFEGEIIKACNVVNHLQQEEVCVHVRYTDGDAEDMALEEVERLLIPFKPPRVEVFIFTWNDEFILPHTLSFYKARLGHSTDRHIRYTIVDNESSDRTPQLARQMGCRVMSYNTNNEHNDQILLQQKNQVWQTKCLAHTRWVMVVDADEWMDVTLTKIDMYQRANVSVVAGEGYDMVSAADTEDLRTVTKGLRDEFYDKDCLFDRTRIRNMNYKGGCHDAAPSEHGMEKGHVHYAQNADFPVPLPTLFHMKYFSLEATLKRTDALRGRQAKVQQSLGVMMQSQDAIKAKFALVRAHAAAVPGAEERDGGLWEL